MAKPDFMKPRVFKANDGKWLMIVYNNREETYDFARTSSFKELSKEGGDEYTRYDAIRLCKDSSMKEVHFTDEIKAHGIICDCKDIDKGNNMGIKGCKCKLVDDNERTLQELDIDFVEIKKREIDEVVK